MKSVGSTLAPDRFVVLYQKAMTGFSPYSLPFWPALITLWRVIWIFSSGVVSTPFSNVGPSLARRVVGTVARLGRERLRGAAALGRRCSSVPHAPSRNARALEAQMSGINDFFKGLPSLFCARRRAPGTGSP